MDIGALANDWLANLSGPASVDPLYRGPDDHWLYALPSSALYELPSPIRFPQPAADPAPRMIAWSAPPTEPLTIRITRSTPMDGSFDYGNWQSAQPLGGYAGTPGTYSVDTPVSELLRQIGSPEARAAYDASLAQTLFSPLALRSFSLPPLRFPGTQPATQQAASPGASWMSWLLYGGLALAAVLLLKR